MSENLESLLADALNPDLPQDQKAAALSQAIALSLLNLQLCAHAVRIMQFPIEPTPKSHPRKSKTQKALEELDSHMRAAYLKG